MFIPLAAMASWQKIALGFGVFVLLFGRGGDEEVNIRLEGMKEFTYEDGRGSVVVSTLDHRQGLVAFKNDGTSLVHYALVSIDGEWVGDESTSNADEKRKWCRRLFGSGERRLHKIKKLQSAEGFDGGDFGSHRVEAHIFVKDGHKARFVRLLEYDLTISDVYRSAPEGSGMYWVLEIHPTYITEGNGW